MKSHLTKLIETLESAANYITPDEDGVVPASAEEKATVYGVLGYRIGRALSHARALANKQ